MMLEPFSFSIFSSLKKDQEMALFIFYFHPHISFVEVFCRRNRIFHFYNTFLAVCEVDLWTRFGKGQQSSF